jgi:superfamily II DNA or RNA helicase
MSHKDFKFESINDTQAHSASNGFLTLAGSKKGLAKIRSMLHLHNKGMKWKIQNAESVVAYYSRMNLDFLSEEKRNSILLKVSTAQKTIKESYEQMDQKFYDDVEFDGDPAVEVSVGYWWLAENGKELVKNSTIPPVHLKGLRDYQKETIDTLLETTHSSCMLATGLGKSMIIASICVSAVTVGKRVCVVVPTTYLVGQIYKTIRNYVENTKPYGGIYKQLPLGADVLVVTAASAAKFISDYHVVLVDEFHHSTSNTWVNLLASADRATHMYGLTATPFRSDGMDLALHAFLGPVVYKKDTKWGIENKWLKSLSVYMVSVKPTKGDRNIFIPDSYNMQKAYAALVVNAPECFKKILEIVSKSLNSGRKILVLFKTIRAGVLFRDYCKGSVSFNVASEKNRKPIQDFIEGKTSILVSNDRLLSEGVDIPALDMLILVTQNSSNTITAQAVGRILRPVSGFTKDAVVFDVAVEGYTQFTRNQRVRAKAYQEITNNVKVVS